MKHNCNYCTAASNKTRDELSDAGWSFAQFYAPKKLYFTACPKKECLDKLATDFRERLASKCKQCGETID